MEIPQSNVRRHVRRSMIEPAQLRGSGQQGLYHCIIRDLSEGGAKLRVPLDFPKQGDFRLIAKTVGIDCPVRIVWRAEHSIGVSFDQSTA